MRLRIPSYINYLRVFFFSLGTVNIICAQLPSRLGMQLNLRLRSLYALLLCLFFLFLFFTVKYVHVENEKVRKLKHKI